MVANLSDAISWIVKEAGDDDIPRLLDAINGRKKLLGQVRAASVVPGTSVRTTGLSPKYLNGLTGTVVAVRGTRADVELDATSTSTLRFTGGRRFYVPSDTPKHLLRGVPLPCCGSAS